MGAAISVWIVVIWDQDVIDAFSVRQGQRFILGDAPHAWPFPEGLLGAPSLSVVDYTGAEPELCVPERRPIRRGQRHRAEFGNFRVIVGSSGVESEIRTWFGSPPDYRTWASLAGSVAVFALVLVTLRYAVPELTDVRPLESTSPFTPELRHFAATVAESELDGPEPNVAEYVFPNSSAITGWSRCGGETDMGTARATTGDARYAVTGPKDNPDPHLSRLLRWPRRVIRTDTDPTVISGLDTPNLPDLDAPSAPWGRDSTLGTDEVSARGNMWGDRIDIAPGDEESLGKTHLDGGMVKRVEVARESTEPTRLPARVVHTQLRVTGPLRPSVVERTLVPSLERVRDCYRADRESTGSREARVDVRFVVATDGSAREPSARTDQPLGASTLSCILEQFKGLEFAAASEESQISYPLVLIPGSVNASTPVERLQLAPEIPRDETPVIPCSGKRRTGPCKR
jgi:hypothetical protein